MPTLTQSLSDLKTLLPSNKDQYTTLNLELQELKPQMKMLHQALAQQETELERLTTRCRYLPTDRKLKKLRKELAAQTAETKVSCDSLSDTIKLLQLRMDKILEQRQLEELKSIALDYSPRFDFKADGAQNEFITHTFDLPIDDLFVAVQLASSLCESLQYQYVSGNRYYHWLIDQAARGDRGENAMGDTANSAGIPEIENQYNDKLDEMRKKRSYLTMLRIAAESQYHQLLKELPENAPFIPKMLRKTDEELEAQIESRKAAKWAGQRAQAQTVAKEEHLHARKEERIYKPRM